MKKLISEYLNGLYYVSTVDNGVYLTVDGSQIGFSNIEDKISKVFMISEDFAHALVFNWLLGGGIKSIKQNWDKTYIINNSDVYSYDYAKPAIKTRILEYIVTLNHD